LFPKPELAMESNSLIINNYFCKVLHSSESFYIC
jgi:hypothetical protein